MAHFVLAGATEARMGMKIRLGGRLLAYLVALGMTSPGCSWIQHGRPPRIGEKFQLQSAVVAAPEGPGWSATRDFDAQGRRFDVVHSSGAALDQRIFLGETDEKATSPRAEALSASLTSTARSQLRDPKATVHELNSGLPARFGTSATAVVLRVEESEAKAGLLERASAYSAAVYVAPPEAPDRLVVIFYSASDLPQEQFEQTWRALLEGTEFRPANAASIRAAAGADDFPKFVAPGLARRSLTLPKLGFQWGLARERWVAPGGFSRAWGLGLGLTDAVELDTPGYLRVSFGEVEALTRPEFAVGAGLTEFQHDAVRGSVWSFGLGLEGRRRLAADVALRGAVSAEGAHESRTGRTHPGGAASLGVVWDPHTIVTLGFEAGASSRPWDHYDSFVWVGGRDSPLITIHALFVDIGLTGALARRDGRSGLLAGAKCFVTF
ncbi:MAG: hypothetical protein U0229_14900 [Anaeromyxobacter sp.]